MVLAVGMAAAQPVSFSREVAPVLAMNCHLCHGANPESAAGGLSTTTWTELMKGGDLGPAIVAGDPQGSPLYQFISGARGEAHRMPLRGAPLDAAQIETIRRWIGEGASADRADSEQYLLTLPAVRMERTAPLRIRARVPVVAYASLEISGVDGARLYLDGGAVREDRGVAAIAAPGEWMEWNLRRAPHWPAEVHVTFRIAYSRSAPSGAELIAGSRRTTLR
jgi:cytochrome c